MVSLKSIANRIVSQVFAVSSLPEMTIDEYGNKEWRLNGLLHREDGPAIERKNGDRLWYINGKSHREDGPAVEYANGSKLWCLNDKSIRYDPKTWDQLINDIHIESIMNK